MSILKELELDIKKILKQAGYEVERLAMEESNRKDLGEYQLNDAMQLAKTYHDNPRNIAERIKGELEKDSRFTNLNIAGPGFINFSLSNEYIVEILNRMNQDIFNNIDKKAPKKIVIDYGGANVAKALHVGHLRSANIGEALKRLAILLGYDALGDAIHYIENKKSSSFEIEKYVLSENFAANIPKQELKYDNEYGGFSVDGKEYKIRVNKKSLLPNVWSNILANEKFGTLVTASLGGYTWCENSRLNKLTSWQNNSVQDIPSEVIYLEDVDTNCKWSMGMGAMPDDEDYLATFGFGYAKYQHISSGINQNLTVFVPKDDKLKVNMLNLKNELPKKRKIKIVYYIKPVLDEDEIKSDGYLNLEFKENSNMILCKNLANSDFDRIMYVSSNEKIKSFTGNKKYFFGKGTINNPDGLKYMNLNSENSLGKESCIAVQMEVNLEAYESKNICILLGEEKNELDCMDIGYKYSNINNCQEELKIVKNYWEDLIENVQVETPLESMNIMLNGFCMYQTICCRMMARTAFYQCGGAYRI